MNNQRRKELNAISSRLVKLVEMIESASNEADEIRGQIEDCRDEEQEYYDNMPESLQGGEKGEAAQEAINQLDEAYNAIDAVCDSLSEFSADDITASLENAVS